MTWLELQVKSQVEHLLEKNLEIQLEIQNLKFQAHTWDLKFVLEIWFLKNKGDFISDFKEVFWNYTVQ